jgi:hypothetical protein
VDTERLNGRLGWSCRNRSIVIREVYKPVCHPVNLPAGPRRAVLYPRTSLRAALRLRESVFNGPVNQFGNRR